MAAAYDHANGTNGVNGTESFPPGRYSKVPPTIVVTVTDAEGPVDIEISLDEDIQEDPTELCTLLENEHSTKDTWLTVAIAYAKHKKADVAIEVLSSGINVFARGSPQERLSILNCLCWLYLLKCRQAPRVLPDGKTDSDEIKTKDFYIQAATSVLNDASRISPSYPPLFLARGVLYLLRASLQAPPTAAGPGQISSERIDTLKQAAKCFEDALRASNGKNLLAKLGKARVNFSMGKYADALKIYQNVLESSPGLIDPDPRIGIGCCFWNLGFKDDAAQAWQRALDLNPKSKQALILLGIYNVQLTAQLPPSDPNFLNLTKKAMGQFIGPAFTQDNRYPLSCATLGSWYTARKAWDKVETLSRRAIELTDVNDIASDGWYYLARKAHQDDDSKSATDYYHRSDRARGGDDRGYIPAKFGSAQMRVLMGDFDGAKFRLEKILQQQPTLEAQILLGTLYAEDVFAAQASGSKEDKSSELKKALKYLEDVVKAWKDPKRKLQPDQSVLLNLARLYEAEHPDKSLKCLEEVEQLELDAIPDEDYPEEYEDEDALKNSLRELLPPQLLNNMGCFHYQNERFVHARALFQTALTACVKAASRDETIDTDALVTSISYNLGRTYESEGMLEEAKGVYEGLLKRHPDYIDARVRQAYITLRQHPSDEGPKAVVKLYEENKSNLEVRALYGWYVSKSKKKTFNIADDQEQRHYKHTLINFDKHDRYSLTGMGNIHLAIAREMPRGTEQDKEKRRKMYEKAVEFFDKTLMLDPKNAYAAQGLAIALIEDKKDYSSALQILTKVKETVKDFGVFMNLGHTYCETKQYTRAIENYEAALAKDRARDPAILACLGRVWLLRGKHEKNLQAMKTSLEYSQRALEVLPNQTQFKFNVAFVQIQIAQLVNNMPESQRTLEEVETASTGLDESIESLFAIAKLPDPPFPKNDIEQRAYMGKTMRKQLDRATQSQRTYEETNANKLQQAREAREAEQKRREEEKRKAEEEAAEKRRKALEDRRKQEEHDRAVMEKRTEEQRQRQELIDDSDMRKADRKRRGGGGGKRKKKSEMDDSDSDGIVGDSDAEDRPRRRRNSASGTEGLSEEERPPRQKKRKLERKKKEPAGKFKSSEFVGDSDDDDDDVDVAAAASSPVPSDNDSADEGAAVTAPRSRKRVIDEDEDEDDDDAAPAPQRNGDAAMDSDEDE
ncbi:TPR-like protein [Aaosphaeria arxii CBS 175.79]|uniref:TPR-like protein n=1 Tax=Aaosphaeria arxii CBS 175.79 TaxID=1450172 RepID=A0A6A5XHG5_9PLEO|nr:TPR-like protein [Aaosphaeria arxii CBS 175.79]KAF2012715.1 TPR-like protein [Aaosphaeria arxii CBS 175.79]